MWFRKLRSHHDPEARGGVAIAPRRSQTFGPRVVEALEERALMSMGGHDHHMMHNPHTSFVPTNLVSDVPGLAKLTDSNLVNPWGITSSTTSPWWVNDNGAGVSTLYSISRPGTTPPVSKLPLTVTIPSPTGGMSPSAPTGIVFNGTSDFAVTKDSKSGASVFIFATEDGTVSGWNPTTNAVRTVDNSGSGAVYKGLAMGSSNGVNNLYATNFHSGKVDVFDNTFTPQTLSKNQFTDPKLPRGYAPFGIANFNGKLFVTYAKQNAAKHDDVSGQGHGFVDEFDTSGHLIERVALRGTLNSPWGLAMAPSSFGEFGGDLLVGNFGNGRINAFKQMGNGKFRFDDQLRDSQRQKITIDGLWGLAFGNDAKAGPSNTLFFTAGLNGEKDGLFGTLTTAM